LRREIPTLNKIVQTINNDPDLPNIPCTSLRGILKELNFKYTKRSRNSALRERGYLVVWRQNYIEDIWRYRSEDRTIYFLGETWVNAGLDIQYVVMVIRYDMIDDCRLRYDRSVFV
jgi:hypothetical protein